MTQHSKVFMMDTKEELHNKARIYLLHEINKTARLGKKSMTIGLSGGSMAQLMCNVLKTIQPEEIEEPMSLEGLHFFVCDERVVPVDHADSNTGTYRNLLPEDLKKNLADFHYHKDLKVCAEDYKAVLRSLEPPLTEKGLPIFDLLLLGMGPDGHTCSLFGRQTNPSQNEDSVISIDDSPKPPPERVSITFAVIHAARDVAFIVTGADKAEAVKEILENASGSEAPLPAAVANNRKDVVWFIDQNSGSKLNPDCLTKFDL